MLNYVKIVKILAHIKNSVTGYSPIHGTMLCIVVDVLFYDTPTY